MTDRATEGGATVSAASPTPDKAGIQRSLLALFEPGDVIELRALHPAIDGGKKAVSSGYFDGDHWQQLIDEAERLNLAGAQVYVTMNQLDPALLAGSPNCVKSPARKTTTDADITRRRWLLLDLDHARPTNTSATDAQSNATFELAQTIFLAMKARGWPSPVAALSGNGVHLLYAIDLPADDESKKLVEGALAGLAALFDSDDIKVDRSVSNAARICRLHGTVASKGGHTIETPHRVSYIMKAPERVIVTVDQLQAVAALAPAKPVARRATAAPGSAGTSYPADEIIPMGVELDRLIADLRAALRTLSADSYADWFRYGLALKTLGTAGRDLWMEWSFKSAKFDEGEASAKWASFRPERTSHKVIFADAQSAGWVNTGSGPGLHDGASLDGIDIEACGTATRLRKGAAGPAAMPASAGGGDTPLPDADAPGEDDDGLSGLSHAPVFDYGMCPGILGRFIKSETEFSEAPPIGILANLITRLSADIGRTCFIRAEHKKMHLRINWLCAGPTALGRKGTAAAVATAVRDAAFERQGQASAVPASMTSRTLPASADAMLPARTETSLATGEGLIAMLRTSARKEDTADFKPPGLIDNRLLVDAQEFAGVLKKASGKEATLSPRLREAWDGDTLSNTSAANAMQAERPHVVVNASVPDSELVRLLTGDSAVEASNGLLNRFIITYQRRDKIVADRAAGARWVFEQMADAYLVAVATACGHESRYSVTDESSVEITMSEPARAGYREWYLATQGRAAAAYVQALLAREADYLQRYAALLALLRGCLCIEAADIEAAKLLLDYWRGSLEFIFSQGQQTAAEELMHEDSKKLVNKMPTGRIVTMNDLRHTPKARRMVLLNWMQRQSPPWVALKNVIPPGGGRTRVEITRLQ